MVLCSKRSQRLPTMRKNVAGQPWYLLLEKTSLTSIYMGFSRSVSHEMGCAHAHHHVLDLHGQDEMTFERAFVGLRLSSVTCSRYVRVGRLESESASVGCLSEQLIPLFR